jgi:hypothetical protein
MSRAIIAGAVIIAAAIIAAAFIVRPEAPFQTPREDRVRAACMKGLPGASTIKIERCVGLVLNGGIVSHDE